MYPGLGMNAWTLQSLSFDEIGCPRPHPSALEMASSRVQRWRKPVSRSSVRSARYVSCSDAEKHSEAIWSASGTGRTASISTPTSRLVERATAAASSDRETLKCRSPAGMREERMGLPCGPYSNSIRAGAIPNLAARIWRTSPRVVMKRWRSRSETKRSARRYSSSVRQAAIPSIISGTASSSKTKTSRSSSSGAGLTTLYLGSAARVIRGSRSLGALVYSSAI